MPSLLLNLHMIFATVVQGHYACCCADTWASEVGMLSGSLPRLILNLRPVPPGVNGGISALGLVASAAGGLCMGAVLWLTGLVTGETRELELLIARITSGSLLCRTPQCSQATFWLSLGLCTGLGGSLVDSLLGATMQFSGYCPMSHRVVAHTGPHVHHISGSPWLSNESVNALSAGLSSIGAVCGVAWQLRASLQ